MTPAITAPAIVISSRQSSHAMCVSIPEHIEL